MIEELRRSWRYFLWKSSRDRRPGFAGPIPYLLAMRLVITIVVSIRLLALTPNRGYPASIALIAVMAALAAADWFLVVKSGPNEPGSTAVARWLIALDVAAVSLASWLTSVPTSDLFLFYFHPILSAAEFFHFRHVLFTVGGVFFGLELPVLFHEDIDMFHGQMMVLMRWWVLCGFAMLALMLVRFQQTQNGALRDNNQYLMSLIDFQRECGERFTVESVIDLARKRVLSMPNVARASVWLEHPQEFGTSMEPDGLLRGELSAVELRLAERCREALRPQTEQRGEVEVAAVPIRTWDRFRGIIFAESREGFPFSPEALSFLRFPSQSSDSEVMFPFSPETLSFLQLFGEICGYAIARAERVAIFRETSLTTAALVMSDRVIEWLMGHLTEHLKLDFATISSVDRFGKTVSMTRARNVQPGFWMSKASYPLSHKDILADKVRRPFAELIVGPDPRFDEETYVRFDHHDLARIFAPVWYNDEVVGVLEAGVDSARESHLRENFSEIETLARHLGGPLQEIQFQRFLERIAEAAMRVVSAHGATVHVEGFHGAAGVAAAGEFVSRFTITDWPLVGEAMRGRGCVATAPGGTDVGSQDPHLPALGVHGMAAHPVRLREGRQGVVVVYSVDPTHVFRASERELLASFAGLVEGAIINRLLLDDFASSAKWAWLVASQQPIIQSLVGERSAQEVLSDIADRTRHMLGARGLALFERKTSHMLGRPHTDGHLSSGLQDPAGKAKGALLGNSEFHESYMDDCDPKVKSLAIVPLRFRDNVGPEGVLIATFAEHRKFAAGDIQAIHQLAAAAAVAIRTARLQEKATQPRGPLRDNLRALQDLERLIAAGLTDPNPLEVLKTILKNAVKVVGVDDVAVYLMEWGASEAMLVPHYFEGFKGCTVRPQTLGEGVVGHAAASGMSEIVTDVSALKASGRGYVETSPTTQSELVVPLKDPSGAVLGVLNLESADIGYFTDDHREWVEVLALQGVILIRSLEVRRSIDQAIHCIGAVIERFKRDQKADTILRLALAAITAQEGLGFTRAVAFRVAEGSLAGWLACGPKTEPGAPRAGSLEILLDQAQQHQREVEAGLAPAEIEKRVGGIEVTVDRSLLAGKPELLSPDAHQWCATLLQRYVSGKLPPEVAYLPVSSPAGEVIAFLLLDRGAEVAGRPYRAAMTQAALRNARPLAELVALGIRNEDLAGRLSDAGRQSEWSSFIEETVHSLVTPLIAQENTISDLLDLQADHLSNGVFRDLVRKLKSENTMAKEIASRVHEYTRPLGRLRKIDLIPLVREAVGNCTEVTLTLPEGKAWIAGNGERLRDALICLVTNSREAADTAKRPCRIDIDLTMDVRARQCEIRIADQSGAPTVPLADMIKRYYTSKASGQGLGLSFVRRIVDGHGGRFRPELIEDPPGLLVVLSLPLIGEEQHANSSSG